jgi:hypothetical protein
VTRPGRRSRLALAGIAAWLAAAGPAAAADADLHSGLAYLRAGAQTEAEQHLMRYREGSRDSDVRVGIDRALALLKQPLAEDVREYIADTIEDIVRMNAEPRGRPARPTYAVRMFPVFP